MNNALWVTCLILWIGSVNSGFPEFGHHFDVHYDCDPNWSSINGASCGDYGRKKYCKKDGDHFGEGWKKKWGRFENWADADGRTPLVCPECGCEEGAGVNIRKTLRYSFWCNAGWSSWNRKTCKTYANRNYCEDDDYGTGWKRESWMAFENWADAKGQTALVCPQCGCGISEKEHTLSAEDANYIGKVAYDIAGFKGWRERKFVYANATYRTNKKDNPSSRVTGRDDEKNGYGIYTIRMKILGNPKGVFNYGPHSFSFPPFCVRIYTVNTGPCCKPSIHNWETC